MVAMGTHPFASLLSFLRLVFSSVDSFMFVCFTVVTFVVIGVYAPEMVDLATIFTTVTLLSMMRMVFVMLPTLAQAISQVMVRSM